MRTTCLYCEELLIPLPGKRAACPVCSADWLASITITLPELHRLRGGDLLLDKGVPTRDGRRLDGS